MTFRLAGINNQNFLMRDEETGTYWQQISGVAVAGPLAGQRLEIVHADELTFKLWKAEQPKGTVLADDAKFIADYAKRDWDVEMKKMPTVLNYAGNGRKPRDLMLGVQAGSASRAFPYEVVIKEKLIQDRVGAMPVLLVVGSDGESVRVFKRKLAGVVEPPEFYRLSDSDEFMDSTTGSKWNFQGCVESGKLAAGTCLERVDVIKDYWFDWRHYHPETTVFALKPRG